jgi:hypothetical protein
VEAIPLSQNHRDKLKEMIGYLFPEYPFISLGGEYVSLSRSKPDDFDISWNRLHWLELLMREGLRRIYVLGKYDDVWMFHKVREITLSLMAPEVRHPVSLFYDEYKKILPQKPKENQVKSA